MQYEFSYKIKRELALQCAIIAVDEIGSREDLEAIDYVSSCGCKLIATVHGSSIDDIKSKPVLKELVQKGLFERFVILSNIAGIGHLEAIYDSMEHKIYG